MYIHILKFQLKKEWVLPLIEHQDGNMIGRWCGIVTDVVSHIFVMVLDRTMGSISFEPKLKDMSLDRMGFILNHPDYLYVGPKMDFGNLYSVHCNSCKRGSGPLLTKVQFPPFSPLVGCQLWRSSVAQLNADSSEPPDLTYVALWLALGSGPIYFDNQHLIIINQL